MKVLMLGWEFPPHISGGLGTACHGLTQGLAQHGVDVIFVVPRAFGDEDRSHLELIGLNDAETGTDVVPAAPAEDRLPDRPKPRAHEPGGDVEASPDPVGPRDAAAEAPIGAARPSEAPPAAHTKISVLAVDSLLRPYLDAAAYEVRRAEHPSAAPAAPTDDPPPVPAAVGSGSAAWTAFSEQIASAPASSAPAPARRRPALQGGYGEGLFEEVARYAEAVAELARDRTFDVVHAHDWMTIPAGVAAARATGRPLVVHVHACEVDRSGARPDPRVRDIEQMGLDEADRVIVVSHFTAGVLRRHYRLDMSKVRVVHNAVTQEESRRGRWTKNISEPLVLFLGRVTFQKGPDYFLEAARRVIQQRPDVKFVMGGSGDMLPRMIEHAAQLGVARNVHFTGFLRGREVEHMYAIADLYVMPSVSEPFGISPLEAMALDVPVIVSRQSGVAEVLKHALKVDFWDVQDLANKILAVLERPLLRDYLREAGRAEVRRLRWEASGARVLDVYRELAS